MSERDSRMPIASSAVAAQSASKPAFSATETANIRTKTSSSTTRMTGRALFIVALTPARDGQQTADVPVRDANAECSERWLRKSPWSEVGQCAEAEGRGTSGFVQVFRGDLALGA